MFYITYNSTTYIEKVKEYFKLVYPRNCDFLFKNLFINEANMASAVLRMEKSL